MKKIQSSDGKWYYIREIAREMPMEGGWLSMSGEPDENGHDWLPFAFWKVSHVEEVEATPEEVERYRARMPEAARKAEAKEYWIENEKGGYAEPYTRFEATNIARKESADYSSVIFVRHERAYTPDVIFCSGREYRPVEPE